MMEQMSSVMTPQMLGMVYEYSMTTLGAVLVILGSIWIGAKVAHIVRRSLSEAKVDMTVVKFVSNSSRWLIIVAAVVSALGMFGVETTSFAAVIAASGLAIGLAFQGSLANLAAGLMLLIFRPFKVGDFITASGVTGTVDEIGLFFTNIDTPEKKRIVCPNSKIFGSTIENVSYHPVRRIDLTVGVSYDADLDETKSVLMAVLIDEPLVKEDPAPAVILSELGASTIDWSVRAWVASSDFAAAKEKLLWQIKTKLDHAGIGIPFPQMDVHVSSAGLAPLANGRTQDTHDIDRHHNA